MTKLITTETEYNGTKISRLYLKDILDRIECGLYDIFIEKGKDYDTVHRLTKIPELYILAEDRTKYFATILRDDKFRLCYFYDDLRCGIWNLRNFIDDISSDFKVIRTKHVPSIEDRVSALEARQDNTWSDEYEFKNLRYIETCFDRKINQLECLIWFDPDTHTYSIVVTTVTDCRLVGRLKPSDDHYQKHFDSLDEAYKYITWVTDTIESCDLVNRERLLQNALLK